MENSRFPIDKKAPRRYTTLCSTGARRRGERKFTPLGTGCNLKRNGRKVLLPALHEP